MAQSIFDDSKENRRESKKKEIYSRYCVMGCVTSGVSARG